MDQYGFTESGTVTISGTEFINSCWEGIGDFRFIEIDLGRNYAQFQIAIGITDSSESAAAVTYRVLGDGVQLATGDLTLGQLIPLDLPVNDMLLPRHRQVASVPLRRQSTVVVMAGAGAVPVREEAGRGPSDR